MQSRKVWIALFCMFMAVVLLAACGAKGGDGGGSSSGEPVALLMYELGNEDEPSSRILNDIVEEFNQREDINATIEVRYIPSDTYYTRLNAAVAANGAPDIFELHAAGRMENFVNAKRILPLTEAMDADPEWKGRFNNGVFDMLTFNGDIYGVPSAIAAVPLFYNKEIFAEYDLDVPVTYDDLKQVVETLVDQGVTPFAMGGKESWVPAMLSEIVANRIGGNEPYDLLMAGQGNWNDPSFVEMGHVMQELSDMGAFGEGYLSAGNDEMMNTFLNGQAAMMVTGSWAIGSIVSDESLVKDVTGIVKFPVFEHGKGSVDTWLGQPNGNRVISSTVQDKAAAIEFLKMFSSDEVQRRLVEEDGQIPVTDVETDPEKVPELSRELNRLMADMDSLFIFYDVGLGPQVGQEYDNKIQEILAGKSSEQAFEELQAYTEEVRAVEPIE